MPEQDIITDPPIAPPTDRPGYATTEFWLALANLILNFVAALLALIHPGFHIKPEVQAFVVAAAPLAASIGAGFYAMSRARSKAAAATIVTTKMGIDADREHLAVQIAREKQAWDIAALADAARRNKRAA